MFGPRVPISFRFAYSSPKVLASILFVILYLIAVLYLRNISAHDPTSYFFDTRHGHDRIYSTTREQQAAKFIESANALTRQHTPTAEPTLCLGVATVSRPDKQYIGSTIGSLLEGLSDAERRHIHFVFFIAHTDQHVHPVYGEKWVETLPDTLLSYEGNATELAKIRKWEVERDYRAKGLYDYSYLLQKCYETGATYIAMVEGDVLAVDGWYPRAIAATETVDTEATWDNEKSSWLYIRMFYTEMYLGWNIEELPVYVGWSVLAFLVLTMSLIGLRARSKILQRELTNPTLAVITLVCLPACITLYFLAGRGIVQPMEAGVRPMNNFGCCSQGFIFSRHVVPLILDRIQHHTVEYIDMLMEAVAGADGLARWVVVPSLLQHIGGQSSKGDEIADSRAQMIWSFGFELYDAAKVRMLSHSGLYP